MPYPSSPSDFVSGPSQRSRFSSADARSTELSGRNPPRTFGLGSRRSWRSIRQLSAQKVLHRGSHVTMFNIDRCIHRAHVVLGNSPGEVIKRFPQLGMSEQNGGPYDRNSVVWREIDAVVAEHREIEGFDEAAGGIARDDVNLSGRERAIDEIEFHDARRCRKAELIRLEQTSVSIRAFGELVAKSRPPLRFHPT